MAATQTVLSISDILTLAFSTGVITALLNNLLGWLRDWKKDHTSTKRDPRYSAMRIAVILEKFAIECANVISDNDLYKKAEGHAGAAHGTLPPLREFPADTDWKALDPALSARTLSLPNELSLADGTIKFWWDIEPGDQGILLHACDLQAGKCGYIAWQLAADMRRGYGLPAFNPEHTAWDVVKTIKDQHDIEIKRLKDAAC